MAGEPRFITHLPGSSRKGVEVQQGQLELVADSRIEEGASSLPASGWLVDFQSLRTRLYLLTGWDLLALSGVDNLPDTWLNRWTPLDLFLVLIIALATARLWGLALGRCGPGHSGADLAGAGGPRMIWLNLLAVAALLRLVPEGPARQGERV